MHSGIHLFSKQLIATFYYIVNLKFDHFSNWDNSGCNLVETNQFYTVCSCNHLTSFAVLMDVNGNLESV